MDVFELVGRIAIEGADKAAKTIDGMSEKGGKLGNVFGKLGSAAVKGFKVAAGAAAAAGTAVADGHQILLVPGVEPHAVELVPSDYVHETQFRAFVDVRFRFILRCETSELLGDLLRPFA